VTHSPYARAPDLTVTLSRIAVQYLTLIFHQHTEAKDGITSKWHGPVFLCEGSPDVASFVVVLCK
jgi:hypothetical protein